MNGDNRLRNALAFLGAQIDLILGAAEPEPQGLIRRVTII
jgi:hypothetical protein